jgi:hypothetical protein
VSDQIGDGRWRVMKCCCIAGMKPGSLPPGEECDHCMGNGLMWIRPTGHTFLYPGGPATGYSGKVQGPLDYAQALP